MIILKDNFSVTVSTVPAYFFSVALTYFIQALDNIQRKYSHYNTVHQIDCIVLILELITSI